MYRYNECYLFRNYHKLGKAKMPTCTFAFKKYSVHVTQSLLLLVVDASKMPSVMSL